jgi:hypothetical protein
MASENCHCKGNRHVCMCVAAGSNLISKINTCILLRFCLLLHVKFPGRTESSAQTSDCRPTECPQKCPYILHHCATHYHSGAVFAHSLRTDSCSMRLHTTQYIAVCPYTLSPYTYRTQRSPVHIAELCKNNCCPTNSEVTH